MTSPISLSGERPIKVASTPLGSSDLTPIALRGEEEISRPYVFTVDFASPLASITATQVLGKPMALRIPIEGPVAGQERIVHGFIRRFSNLGKQRDLTRYRAELVPGLWFLTLSTNTRTFENQSVVDIVREVCRLDAVQDFKTSLFRQRTPPPLPYVVQYGETDFDFVSRLLEEAGLYYVFEHATDGNTLVVSDAFGDLLPAPQTSPVTVRQATVGGRPPVDTAFDLTRDFAVLTKGIDLSDHDLLRADKIGQSPSETAGARGRRVVFVGDLSTVDLGPDSQRRVEVEEAVRDVVRGRSNCPAFEAGAGVKIDGAPITESDGEMLLLTVKHAVEIGDVQAGGGFAANYTNEWTAIPSSHFFRPPRRTPRTSVRGTMTAKIVGAGSAGDIDVDASGRVLLKFPWDKGAGKDGKSKHRVHVASVWSGTAWGFVQHPRLGQEVLVEFMDGDPERPIVTGRVYNNTNTPPYALPANKTQSGWKSRTVGGADANFNEIRFEDKKGEEHVHVQAEKDLQVLVKNDETWTTGHDRTETIQRNHTQTITEGTQTIKVTKGDQIINAHEGDQALHVGTGNQDIGVQKGNQRLQTIDGNQVVDINGDQTITVKKGDHKENIKDGKSTFTVETGTLTIRALNDNVTLRADIGDMSIKADAGKIKIEAAMEIELKVGPCSIKLAPSGITIKGPTVKIEGQGQVEVKGGMVKVEGQGMLQMKAPMAQLNGDGMLMAKGGVTMIN